MMALKKEIKIGDELEFDCSQMNPEGSKSIFMRLVSVQATAVQPMV